MCLKVPKAGRLREQADLLDYARVIEARRTGIYQLDPDEMEAIEEGLAQADRGEFVTAAEIKEDVSAT